MRKEASRLRGSTMAAIALAVCGAQSLVGSAAAAEAAAPPAEAAAPGESVRTQHSIAIDGTQLSYKATAGTLRVRLDKSDAQADIFYVSYDKDGEDRHKRPITFVFNGGPGSSATWLHIGGLGPRRLALGDRWRRTGTACSPRRQCGDLAALHGSRVHRSGRNRIQPCRRDGGGERGRPSFLEHPQRPALARRVHPALSHPQRPLGLAQIPGGRELRRLSRRGAGRAAAGPGRDRAQRRNPDLARNRIHAQPGERLPERLCHGPRSCPPTPPRRFTTASIGGRARPWKQVATEAETFSRGELLLALASGGPPKSPEECPAPLPAWRRSLAWARPTCSASVAALPPRSSPLTCSRTKGRVTGDPRRGR